MKWQIDPVHSSLTFGVRHMMVSTVRGSVGGLSGTLDFDPQRPEAAAIQVVADPATITTGEPKRDGHLRSPDFFDAASYPRIRFTSTKVVPQGDDRFEVHGELEIRGVTRPVTAEAQIEGLFDDPQRGRRAGFSATTTIDRREWGLVWNQPIANGGLLVGEKVKIELGLAAVAVTAAPGAKAA
jgi:polyisoprenoid-binding protein YceI